MMRVKYPPFSLAILAQEIRWSKQRDEDPATLQSVYDRVSTIGASLYFIDAKIANVTRWNARALAQGPT